MERTRRTDVAMPSPEAIAYAMPPSALSRPSESPMVWDETRDSSVGMRPAKPEHETWRDRWWLLELSSVLITVAIIVIMTAVLSEYDDQPTYEWPNTSNMTINTFVAILSAILKPAVLFSVGQCFMELKWIFSHGHRSPRDLEDFEAAARGPWGAILLFFQRFGYLSTLGAIITLLTLAMDPFTQQMLRYHSCPTLSTDKKPSAVAIARINSFTVAESGQDVRYANGDMAPSVHYHLSQNVISSLYEGIYNPPQNESARVGLTCFAGNCTVADYAGIGYSTLSVCYGLEDISNKVVNNQSKTTTNPAAPSANTVYSLPSGTNVTYNVTNMPWMSTNVLDEMFAANSSENSLFAFELLTMSGFNSSETPVMYPFAYGAYLYPCVNTYNNINVTKGALFETQRSSTPLQWTMNGTSPYWSLAGNFPAVAGQDCAGSPTQVGNKTTLALPGDNGQHYVPPPGTQLPPGADVLYFDPACTYIVDSATSYAIADQASLFFGGNNTLVNTGDGPYTVQGPYGLQLLFLSGNADVHSAENFVDGMSWSLAAAMRNTQPPTQMAGTYASGDTCILVQWPWFTLPVAIVAMTCILLAGTVVVSRRAGHGRAAKSTPITEQVRLLRYRIAMFFGRHDHRIHRYEDVRSAPAPGSAGLPPTPKEPHSDEKEVARRSLRASA